MLKCFPDFWTPRFADGNYAFPYDVKMFLLTVDGKKAGQTGYHPYSFLFGDTLRTTGGICDVGVLPEFRGKGYSKILLEFLCGKIIKKYDPLFIPLYTDKPPVYTKMGFEVYYSNQDKKATGEQIFADKEKELTEAEYERLLKAAKSKSNESKSKEVQIYYTKNHQKGNHQ